ncbi:aspartate--tRNA(Asn) ligase [Sphaerimonospora cavernae]|uniref:Aspartate--tRNA ligase n=1 Tax=Sphaerimonospora cavernae TaxID=1740611 RepID=A0ABV6UAJ6_9ACTN
MPRTPIRDLRDHIDQTVTVCGWINALRLQRKVQFVILRDATGMAQVTHKREGEGDELEQVIESLSDEAAVAITGRVVDNPIVNLGGVEIIPEHIQVLGQAEPSLPIDENSGLEHRLDWRFLDVRRRPASRLVFDVQTTLEQGMREYAYGRGFTEMHTPKLMGTASESGAEVFKVGYFDRTAYLAQSPQFYKQMAIAAGIEGVFEIGPVFRAEPSFTSRHATEFTGVDAEMAWIEGLDDVMAFEEGMLAHALQKVADVHGDEIAKVYGTEVKIPAIPFPRVTMAEAIEILRDKGWDPEHQKEDLDPEGERGIAAHIAEQTGHEFVFVTHFPASVRPFYHMRPGGRPDLTLSFDLLWKGLEVTTGAQREHRYDVLSKQAAEKGMNIEPMADYMNCFRYGCPPHGGFGAGLGRMLMVMLGLDSIREATFLFRGPNRLTP